MMAWSAPGLSLLTCSSLSRPPNHFSTRRCAPAGQWRKYSASFTSHSPPRGHKDAKMQLWQASVQRSNIVISMPTRSRVSAIGELGKPLLMNPRSKKSKKVVTMSMIRPESMQTLFMILTGCAAVGQVLEVRTKWGGRVSGPLLAMGTGVILSGAGVIPAASPVYDMVFSTVMPLGAALSLLETDVWSAFGDAGSTLKAFWFGALGTILGTIVSFRIIGSSLGPDGWKIASALCASYVGGTINYAATAQDFQETFFLFGTGIYNCSSFDTALDCRGVLGLNSAHLLAAGMAADNLAMALYFGVIMSIPDDSGKHFPVGHGSTDKLEIQSEQQTNPTVESVAVSLAAAMVACCAGDALASLLPSSFAGSGLALMAVVASFINAFAGQLCGGTGKTSIPIFAGSQNLGGAVMLLFFAVVGASTGLQEALAGGWPLPIFIIILIVVHLTTIFSLGCWSKLPIRSILIASNANIGGPATAAAMANARSWPRLVRPALLVGTLGYTIGTAIGCLVGVHMLQPMV